MRRVLHLIPELSTGGAQRFLLDLAHCQAVAGDYVPLICVFGTPNRAMPTRYGVALEFLSAPRANALLAPRVVRDVARLCRSYRPSLLHSHLWPSVAAGAIVSRAFRIPHVVHVQDTRPFLRSAAPRDGLKRWIYRGLLAASRAQCIAVSVGAMEYAAGPLSLDTGRVAVIPNSVDLEAFGLRPSVQPRGSESADGGAITVGAAGRLVEEKGFGDLIVALSELRVFAPRLRLKIAGEGGYRTALQQMAARLGLEDRVQFLGPVSDMPSFYRACDIFVLPSVASEGLPLVLLEALASGLPTVATRCAGADEVIRHGTDGLLVSVGAPAELSRAIQSLLEDRELRQRMSEAGRQRAVAFGVGAIGQQVTDVYEQMLSGVAGRR